MNTQFPSGRRVVVRCPDLRHPVSEPVVIANIFVHDGRYRERPDSLVDVYTINFTVALHIDTAIGVSRQSSVVRLANGVCDMFLLTGE
jgi:hypothetical protein